MCSYRALQHTVPGSQSMHCKWHFEAACCHAWHASNGSVEVRIPRFQEQHDSPDPVQWVKWHTLDGARPVMGNYRALKTNPCSIGLGILIGALLYRMVSCMACMQSSRWKSPCPILQALWSRHFSAVLRVRRHKSVAHRLSCCGIKYRITCKHHLPT